MPHFCFHPPKRIKEIIRCTEGVVLMEFAFVVPVLLLMFFGAVEISRFIFIVQKLESTASTVNDVITQQTEANLDTTMAALLGQVPQIMQPYSFTSNGLVIVSDFSADASTAKKNWHCSGGGTSTTLTSQVTYTGSTVTWPSGSVVLAGPEEVIITEVIYNFTPIIGGGVISPITIDRVSVYNPRIGFAGSSNTNTGLTTPAPTTSGAMTCSAN